MAGNFDAELPDVIDSVPLADSVFGLVNVEETRVQNNYLGSRHCKTTLDIDKEIKSKKPLKTLAEEEVTTEIDDAQKAAIDEENRNAIKNQISHEKDVFDHHLLATGGPLFRPVLLHAHPSKRVDSSVKQRRLKQKQPFYWNSFTGHVMANIVENLRKEYPLCLESPDITAKPLCLKEGCTFEKALSELLKTTDVQADDWTKIEVADPDANNWKRITMRYMGKSRCRDNKALLIEYACILPDKVHSTVYISCRYCGAVIQTTLNSKAWQSVIVDGLYNMGLANHTSQSDQSSTSVSTSALPAKCVIGKDVYVATVMMGCRALVKKPCKPSSLLRICMFVNCSPNSVISEYIHGGTKRFFVSVTTDS